MINLAGTKQKSYETASRKEVMSQEKVEAVRERRYFSETMRKFILFLI